MIDCIYVKFELNQGFEYYYFLFVFFVDMFLIYQYKILKLLCNDSVIEGYYIMMLEEVVVVNDFV